VLYRDAVAQPWTSLGASRRKDITTGITLWEVGAIANLPLAHNVQTFFVVQGAGRLRAGDSMFIASPGVVVVLPEGGELVAAPSSGVPLLMLQIADVPQTVQRARVAEVIGSEDRPAEELSTLDDRIPDDAVAGPRQEARRAMEDATEAPVSPPAPPLDLSSTGKGASDDDRASQDMSPAPAVSPLARYLASSPVSGRMRHPVVRTPRG